MKKQIFTYKWLYWLSVILSLFYVFLSIVFFTGVFGGGYNVYSAVLITVFVILNIITTISLFEKYKRTVMWINITHGYVIFSMLFNLIFGFGNIAGSLFWLLFYCFYLYFVNKFKIKHIKLEEINDIGKKE